ncbi:hypothetical protein N7465_001133 [Penicillium sp. CMV-2018d]|nr:hypothetical protein N7465_001133 [Penicillium sp. CMV-2018d]
MTNWPLWGLGPLDNICSTSQGLARSPRDLAISIIAARDYIASSSSAATYLYYCVGSSSVNLRKLPD